ncbi:hypothetical protein HDU89_001623 [Geranomyces variabilis]|nr:hypothetical protein HDU89_001623 [Geranomyces variabilis]
MTLETSASSTTSTAVKTRTFQLPKDLNPGRFIGAGGEHVRKIGQLTGTRLKLDTKIMTLVISSENAQDIQNFGVDAALNMIKKHITVILTEQAKQQARGGLAAQKDKRTKEKIDAAKERHFYKQADRERR